MKRRKRRKSLLTLTKKELVIECRQLRKYLSRLRKELREAHNEQSLMMEEGNFKW